jgi:hypothetical protein
MRWRSGTRGRRLRLGVLCGAVLRWRGAEDSQLLIPGIRRPGHHRPVCKGKGSSRLRDASIARIMWCSCVLQAARSRSYANISTLCVRPRRWTRRLLVSNPEEQTARGDAQSLPTDTEDYTRNEFTQPCRGRPPLQQSVPGSFDPPPLTKNPLAQKRPSEVGSQKRSRRPSEFHRQVVRRVIALSISHFVRPLIFATEPFPSAPGSSLWLTATRP